MFYAIAPGQENLGKEDLKMVDRNSSEITASEKEIMKTQNSDLSSLDPKQLEIYKGLKAIGPEISAFFHDGIRILNSNDLETKSYLLAHIAREIGGGLRDILSHKEEEAEKSSEESGHIASIAIALGVDTSNTFVKKWHEVAGKFHKYAHRHGAMKVPRKRSEFEILWKEFEDILFKLVGTYYNLLDRVSRIIKYEKPTEEIIETLPNLLELGARYSYFFRNLKSPQWLKPLKERGYFAPEKNPAPQEVPDKLGYYRIPHWNALDYLENVANRNNEQPSDEITNLLVEIVNSIANYRDEKGERIENYRTDWILIKIITKLPLGKIAKEHIEFIGTSLESKWDTTLIASEIGKSILPKFIDDQAEALLLRLLDVMLEYKETEGGLADKYVSVMNEYWLNEALKKHKPAIAKLCSVKAAEVALNKMLAITNKDESQFNNVSIPTIEEHPQSRFTERYQCQLVHFVRDMFESTMPSQIKEKTDELLKREHPIFKRIALHTINHHYESLKDLFWGWKENPLDESLVKHELYELLKANGSSFSKKQIKNVLMWIESKNYYIPHEIKKDKDRVEKTLAHRKKEWLSTLLSTKDVDAISSYEKCQKINPAAIDHPGFDVWSEIWAGSISPIEKEELVKKSNEEIAEYLVTYKEKKGWRTPSMEGLSETFGNCVSESPERFANDMKPFLSVQHTYQHALLQGLCTAWSEKKGFAWDGILNFIFQMIESEEFWKEKYPKGSYSYRNWFVSQIAELIEEGTKDDNHAFDAKLLPQAEKILLILARKTESDLSEMNDLVTSVLNSSKGKIFSAMVNYSLRHARLFKKEQVERWVEGIKEDFDKRLNRDTEPSLEFSVTLGRYLANIAYLDKNWVTDNINQIFPKDNDPHWEAAFAGYLFYSYRIYEGIYSLLRKNDHYFKALQTKFREDNIAKHLVQHVCIGYIEDWEKLDDDTSLISQLLRSKNADQLSEIVRFFWTQRDKLNEKIKSKIKPIWNVLFEQLLQNKENSEYQKIISSLSKWLSLIDEIDEQALEWLKLSAEYIQADLDASFFIEYLLKHAQKTPAKVGEIYLEMLDAGVYPDYKKENIERIVQILYEQGQKESADRICNMYGAKGFDFLRTMYKKHRNEAHKEVEAAHSGNGGDRTTSDTG